MTSPSMIGLEAALGRTIRYLIIFSAILACLGAGIGQLVSQRPGLFGGLVGAGLTLVMTASTALVMKVTHRHSISVSSAAVMFGWLIKAVLMLGAIVIFRGQEWIDTKVLFFTLVVGILGALTIESLVIYRARIPIFNLHETDRDRSR